MEWRNCHGLNLVPGERAQEQRGCSDRDLRSHVTSQDRDGTQALEYHAVTDATVTKPPQQLQSEAGVYMPVGVNQASLAAAVSFSVDAAATGPQVLAHCGASSWPTLSRVSSRRTGTLLPACSTQPRRLSGPPGTLLHRYAHRRNTAG